MAHRTNITIALACVLLPTTCLAAGISTSRSNIRTKNGFTSAGGSGDFSITATGGTGLLADFDQDGDGIFSSLPNSFLNVDVSPAPPGQVAGASALTLSSGNFSTGSMSLRGVGHTTKLSAATVTATSTLGTTVQNQTVGGAASWTQTNNFAGGTYQFDGLQQSRAAVTHTKTAGAMYDPYIISVAPGAVSAVGTFDVDLSNIDLNFAPDAGESGVAGVFAHARFGVGSTVGVGMLAEGDYSLILTSTGSTSVAAANVFSQSFSLNAGQTYWFDMYSASYTSVVPEPGMIGVASLLAMGCLGRRRR